MPRVTCALLESDPSLLTVVHMARERRVRLKPGGQAARGNEVEMNANGEQGVDLGLLVLDIKINLFVSAPRGLLR